MSQLLLQPLLRSLSLLMVLLAPQLASAQAPALSPEPLIRPGALMIDGQPVKCGDIPALISKRYPDYGAARPGLIILNPKRMRKLPPAARLLIYYHECAHQYVGRNELAADCWAVQKARRDGKLNRPALLDACTFIKKLPANKHHPPGQMRCRHMMRCYDEAFRVRADAKKTPRSLSGDAATPVSGFSKGAEAVFPPRAGARE